MRLAYADPPYPGCAHLYKGHEDYAGEVDHAALIRRLETEFDGFILHTTSGALWDLLPLFADRSGIRIMGWFKPFAAFKRNVSVAYAWEPCIVKACRKPVVNHRVIMRDWIQEGAVRESITMKKGLTGAKPPRVVLWAFEMMGAERNDELTDLYPGTGIVGETWRGWQAERALDGVA